MKILVFVSVFAVLLSSAPGDAVEVSGDQWGTWTRDNSPYDVVGQVRVPPGSTLVIEPGVLVNFKGHYKLIVDNLATLVAEGTESDSIHFTADNPAFGWHGIRLFYAHSSCVISYCHLEYGKATGSGEDLRGGAVYCYYSDPEITHNTFTLNSAYNGGGLYCYGSSPELTHNNFTGNSADSYGGGIACWNSSNPPTFNNVISANRARWGGGICFAASSNPRVSDNTLVGNSATDGGGGLYCYSASPTVDENSITDNSATSGGGIYCQSSSNPTISNNLLSGNSGGAVYCFSSGPLVTGNIITGNPGRGVCCISFSTATISNNTISENSGGGVLTLESGTVISHNEITCNSAGGGGGIHCGRHGDPTIDNNIIEGNTANNGGGISCAQYAYFTVTNNVISGNSATSAGGGIYCPLESTPTIRSNTIIGNSAADGGGIHCRNDAIPAIDSNTIKDNSADLGGGIYFSDCAEPNVRRNCIVGNSARYDGGGIYLSSTDPGLAGNTLSENRADLRGGGICCYDSSPTIVSSILWGDVAPSGSEIYVATGAPKVRYCDLQAGWPGTGNIDADPLFVDPGAGDFHLQPVSPCIDAGSPNSPPDPDGTRTDMGAFYFHQAVLFSPHEFTFNLLLDATAEEVLSLESISDDTVLFSLRSDAGWISFLPDSGFVLPDSTLEISVTFDGHGLPLGPNNAVIFLGLLAPYQSEREIPVIVLIFSTDYTYISLTPDSLPITIPPEGGSFSCWARTFNATDFTYYFDLWIDATLPNGQSYGPIHKRQNHRFRPQYNTGYHLTQNVPGYAPPGEYSYNFKMGALPDQVDYQDSVSFTKLGSGSVSDGSEVSSWDLLGWGDEFVTYARKERTETALIPTEYSLSQNHPNPFNVTTTINYQLPVDGHVKLEVYDLVGRRVATLVDSEQRAGYRSVAWNASGMCSGLYFCRLTTGDFCDTRRMILVK
jgi:parallel beta-helix repeat protein